MALPRSRRRSLLLRPPPHPSPLILRHVASLSELSYFDAHTPTVRQPDGELWQLRGNTLGHLTAGFPAYGEPEYAIPRANGLLTDVFDSYGRPKETRNSVTGAALQRFHYDSGGRLVRMTDADGNTLTLERDGAGRLSALVGPDGERNTLTYDMAGRLATVTTPGGLTHRMDYGSAADPVQRSRLTAYTDPRGNEDLFGYDADGRLTQNRNPAGGGWTLTGTVTEFIEIYNPGTLLTTTLTSAEGRQTHYTTRLDSSSRQEVTAPDGLVTRWESNNGYGGVTRWTKQLPNGATISGTTTPDPYWGMLAAGETTQITYSPGYTQTLATQRSMHNDGVTRSWSQSTRIGDASWRIDYGGILTTATPAGPGISAIVDDQLRPEYLSVAGLDAYAEFQRDPRGRLTEIRLQAAGSSSETRTAGYTWHNAEPGKGQLATITDPLGRTTALDYDSAGRLTRATGPDGRAIEAAYDNNGNMVSLTTPAGITHGFAFDALNQPDTYTAPSSATTWHYNLDRELMRITRPGGQSIELTRDPAGRITRIDTPSGATVYGYDGAGQLITETAGGQRLIHDRFNNLPNSNRWEGDVTGTHRWNLRPALGRITAPDIIIEAGGQSLTVPTSADPAGRPLRVGDIRIGYAPHGAPNTLTLKAMSATRGYNDFGELTRTAHSGPIGFVPPTLEALRSRMIALTGTLRSRLIEREQELGTCYRLGWNAGRDASDTWVYEDMIDESEEGDAERARLIAVYGEPEPRAPDWCIDWIGGKLQELAQTISTTEPGYDWTPYAHGELTHIHNTVAGGAAAVSAQGGGRTLPDTASFLTPEAEADIAELHSLIDQFNAAASGIAFIAEQNYERDKLGRITKQSGTFLGESFEQRYEYNTAGQLAAIDDNGVRTEWDYDPNGNRTHENGTPIATVDSEDRLTTYKGNTYTYTPAGELRTKQSPAGTTTYDYDAMGNLRSVSLPGGTQIDYVIDPRNRRIGKKRNGILEYGLLYQDDLRPIAQLNADNTIRAVFLYADQQNVPAGMLMSGGRTYRFITDHLGSVRAVIDADSGEVKQRLDYDAWGRVTNDTNPGFQPFGFAGGIYDPDTKLTRFGERDYDAQTGRWAAKDPILFAGGDSNLYGYVAQDPVNWIDPSGLATQAEVNAAVQVLRTNYPKDFPKPPESVTPIPMGENGIGMTDWSNNISLNADRFGGKDACVRRGDEYQFLQTLAHEMLHVNEPIFSRFLSSSFRMGNPLGYFHRQLDDRADEMVTQEIIDEYIKTRNADKNCKCR